MDAAREEAPALWARVVTPTGGVRIQCISHAASSPVAGAVELSTDPGCVALRAAVSGQAERMSVLMRVLAVAMMVAAVFGGPIAAGAEEAPGGTTVPVVSGWRWPVDRVEIVEPFVAPAHRYGPGHRGVDLAASVGAAVFAPAAGVVAFAGQVAGRGVVTIDHGDGLVTTLEPVTPGVAIGQPVRAGAQVGVVSTGGHSAIGTVHFGVRENGEYINPLLLLGGVRRAVLLPCC